jgi:hypothetical protein
MHFGLQEGLSKDLAVYPNVTLNLKIRTKDWVLPLSVAFLYDDARFKDFRVYISPDNREPTEGFNQGSYQNVSLVL